MNQIHFQSARPAIQLGSSTYAKAGYTRKANEQDAEKQLKPW